MSGKAKPKIKVMVSSTVYGFESELTQVCAVLESYGYQVLSNHYGTIYVAPGVSNTDACLNAVDECDFFLGIIRPRYGSGITHQEFQRAIQLDKPRGFLAHHSVPLARQLLLQFMYSDEKRRIKNKNFQFKKTSVLEDIRVIDMYNEAIQDGQPLDKRRWVHEFIHFPNEGMRFIQTEFENYQRLQRDLEALRKIK
jgi:hypothetical protein